MNKKKSVWFAIGLTVLVIVIGCGIIAGAIFTLVKYQRANKDFPKHFFETNTVYYTEDKSVVLFCTEKGKPNVATYTKDGETTAYLYWCTGINSSLYLGNYGYYTVLKNGEEIYERDEAIVLSDPSIMKYAFKSELIYNKVTYYSETGERTTEKKTMKFLTCPISEWQGEIPDGTAMVETQKAKLKAEYEAKQN